MLRPESNLGNIEHPADVRWQCVKCTKSCRDTPTHKRRILLLEDDVQHIEARTGKKRDEFSVGGDHGYPYEREMRKDAEGKCVFLEGGLCSIHEIRPLICQFYPFSLREDHTGRMIFDLDSACSGIGKSSAVPTEYYAKLVEAAREAFSRNDRLKVARINQT